MANMENAEKIKKLIGMQKFGEAIEEIKPLLEDAPNNVAYLLDLGFIYGNLNRFEDAIAQYKRVTEIIPNNASGWAGLGFIYRKMGDNDRAIYKFEKSLEFGGDNSMVHFEMGEASFELDQYEAAKASYLLAIQYGNKESDTETLHRVAQCELGLDNPDKAIEIGKNILGSDPGFSSVNQILGLAYFIKEEWKEAVEYFEKYLKHVPGDEPAQNLLREAKEHLQ